MNNPWFSLACKNFMCKKWEIIVQNAFSEISLCIISANTAAVLLQKKKSIEKKEKQKSISWVAAYVMFSFNSVSFHYVSKQNFLWTTIF